MEVGEEYRACVSYATLMPNMIENLTPWLPRFSLPLWQKMLHWLSGRSKAIQLIFVEQPGNFWTYLDDEGTIQLHLMLDVTNASKVIVFITRVQIRRIGWLRRDPLQDCMLVEIGGKRQVPQIIDPPLMSQTTLSFRILHQYKGKRPRRSQPIKCRLRITDQFGQLHYARLSVPSR